MTAPGSSPRVRGTARNLFADQPVVRFIPACAGNSVFPCFCVSGISVHPRVCGEQSIFGALIVSLTGSSPRVRGTVRGSPTRPAYLRFIPACAGNRSSVSLISLCTAVHPRVCGEQVWKNWSRVSRAGSSPRVRGTDFTMDQANTIARFIPACAGNRYETSSQILLTSVHPRVCGEQCSGLRPISVDDGSSPRVRGTDRDVGGIRPRVRFIPACAGNRYSSHTVCSFSTVHPRVCGEQIRMADKKKLTTGSSPRVRGTVQIIGATSTTSRFIPACAGNRGGPKGGKGGSAVHPRVCGEQQALRDKHPLPSGSSPRVRGTGVWTPRRYRARRFIPACAGNRINTTFLVWEPSVHPRVCGEQPRLARRGHRRLRFIPACAGNSCASTSISTAAAVHPRVCGEQTDHTALIFSLHGSSPRVRGTGLHRHHPARKVRFIPACAGNSDYNGRQFFWSAVHPRVCGEQTICRILPYYVAGSSPRVRGTADPCGSGCSDSRFIPACAGNSCVLSRIVYNTPVHPRVCGEQASRLISIPVHLGSSPRVRGTAERCSTPIPSRRFIPACAGNRIVSLLLSAVSAVHPRVCGEQAGEHKLLSP